MAELIDGAMQQAAQRGRQCTGGCYRRAWPRVAIAGAITLVEPVVNTVAHCVFDRWWASRQAGTLAGPAS